MQILLVHCQETTKLYPVHYCLPTLCRLPLLTGAETTAATSDCAPQAVLSAVPERGARRLLLKAFSPSLPAEHLVGGRHDGHAEQRLKDPEEEAHEVEEAHHGVVVEPVDDREEAAEGVRRAEDALRGERGPQAEDAVHQVRAEEEEEGERAVSLACVVKANIPQPPAPGDACDHVDAGPQPIPSVFGAGDEGSGDAQPVDQEAQHQPEVRVEGELHHLLLLHRDVVLDAVVHDRVEGGPVLGLLAAGSAQVLLPLSERRQPLLQLLFPASQLILLCLSRSLPEERIGRLLHHVHGGRALGIERVRFGSLRERVELVHRRPC
mmetsp:Transcript_10074/g.21004  ORF Transcript_10074/g.21004 Transcript_10074/m.21004 type:complete len:322 (+) Transcript_10074:37-1002(+)